MKEIKDFKPENWGIFGESGAMRPVQDRLLIQEDEWKSKFDCSACGGKGHTDEVCPRCLGKKYIFSKIDKEQENCPECSITGERNITYGKVICSVCHGKQGSIITPDDSKLRPTTGIVMAIGSEVTEFKVGAHVLYHNYTGTAFEMYKLNLRIMREHDVLCELRAVNANLVEVKPTELTATGVDA